MRSTGPAWIPEAFRDYIKEYMEIDGLGYWEARRLAYRDVLDQLCFEDGGKGDIYGRVWLDNAIEDYDL